MFCSSSFSYVATIQRQKKRKKEKNKWEAGMSREEEALVDKVASSFVGHPDNKIAWEPWILIMALTQKSFSR